MALLALCGKPFGQKVELLVLVHSNVTHWATAEEQAIRMFHRVCLTARAGRV